MNKQEAILELKEIYEDVYPPGKKHGLDSNGYYFFEWRDEIKYEEIEKLSKSYLDEYFEEGDNIPVRYWMQLMGYTDDFVEKINNSQVNISI